MRFALALLVCLAAPAASQPVALGFGPPLSEDYADGLHPVGWSADGRYLAFVSRRSGGGATMDHFRLVVQDLTSDAQIVDRALTPVESDDAPDLGLEWRRQRGTIQGILDRYGVRAHDAFRLEPINAVASDELPYAVKLRSRSAPDTPSGGPINGLAVELSDRRGQTKVIYDEHFAFERDDAVVAGALMAPSGDRMAVIIETVRGGFESDRTSVYTVVGAGIGPRFFDTPSGGVEH